MQTGRILKTALAVGVVANVYDYLVNIFVLPMTGPQPAFMNDMASMSIPVLVVIDFVAALVFVWFFDRVRAAFGPGAKGGMTFGLYAGILVNFPLWIAMHILVKDWAYATSWVWTINGIVWGVIMGAVAGVVYGKSAPAAT